MLYNLTMKTYVFYSLNSGRNGRGLKKGVTMNRKY